MALVHMLRTVTILVLCWWFTHVHDASQTLLTLLSVLLGLCSAVSIYTSTKSRAMGLGYAPDAPLLVHGTSGMIVAFRATLTAVLML